MKGLIMVEQEAVEAVTSPQVNSGIVDALKERFDVNTMMHKVKLSKDTIFEAGLYAGIGFISGFLLKKYSAYVGVCILLLIGLAVLQQLEVINVVVNWDKVYEQFGIQAAQNVTADTVLGMAWAWMKVNMVISISYVIGLFIGLKVG